MDDIWKKESGFVVERQVCLLPISRHPTSLTRPPVFAVFISKISLRFLNEYLTARIHFRMIWDMENTCWCDHWISDYIYTTANRFLSCYLTAISYHLSLSLEAAYFSFYFAPFCKTVCCAIIRINSLILPYSSGGGSSFVQQCLKMYTKIHKPFQALILNINIVI